MDNMNLLKKEFAHQKLQVINTENCICIVYNAMGLDGMGYKRSMNITYDNLDELINLLNASRNERPKKENNK